MRGYFVGLLVAGLVHSAPQTPSWQHSHPSNYPTGHPYQPFPSQCSAAVAAETQPPNGAWLGWGADVSNNRLAGASAIVDSANAGSLVESCSQSYALGVSATAVVQDGIAYYPTWNGMYVALNYETCKTIWEINVTALILDVAGPSPFAAISAVSRTSAALDGDTLYFGTLAHALFFAVDRNTGSVIDHVQVNSNPAAIVTQPATVWQGYVYVGGSSMEESLAAVVPNYTCCSFIGNFNAYKLNGAKLNLVWSQNMVPENSGWSGVAVWGGQPSIDPFRQQVFIATGNVYNAPEVYQLCQNQSANIAVVQEGLGRDPCIPRNVYVEAVIALDLTTGLINWVNQLTPLDAWTVACLRPGLNPDNCPPNAGPDADFGMAPAFIPGSASTPYGKDMVVVGQKNGNLLGLSAQAGTVFWALASSPDGVEGGLIWGLATDGSKVYYTGVNSLNAPYKLQSGATITNSAHGAVSLADGSIVWETVSPNNSFSLSVPSVANDVVLTGQTGYGGILVGIKGTGAMLALNKASGAIIGSYPVDNLFYGNIAIVDNYVMAGSGYSTAVGTGTFYVWRVT